MLPAILGVRARLAAEDPRLVQSGFTGGRRLNRVIGHLLLAAIKRTSVIGFR